VEGGGKYWWSGDSGGYFIPGCLLPVKGQGNSCHSLLVMLACAYVIVTQDGPATSGIYFPPFLCKVGFHSHA